MRRTAERSKNLALKAKQRKNLREVENLRGENEGQAQHNAYLQKELRAAKAVQRLDMPASFVDELKSRFAAELGRKMADQTIKDNPELARFARRAAHDTAQAFAEPYAFVGDPSDYACIELREHFGTILLTAVVEHAHLNRQVDLMEVTHRRGLEPLDERYEARRSIIR